MSHKCLPPLQLSLYESEKNVYEAEVYRDKLCGKYTKKLENDHLESGKITVY